MEIRVHVGGDDHHVPEVGPCGLPPAACGGAPKYRALSAPWAIISRVGKMVLQIGFENRKCEILVIRMVLGILWEYFGSTLDHSDAET